MIIGPHCAGWFDPRAWGSTLEVQNTITLEVMRVVLATGLFAIGVELPKAYLAEHWKSLVAMVVPTMAFGWVICAGELMVIYMQAYMYANVMNGRVHSYLKVSSTVSFLNYPLSRPWLYPRVSRRPTPSLPPLSSVGSLLSRMYLGIFVGCLAPNPLRTMVSHIRSYLFLCI